MDDHSPTKPTDLTTTSNGPPSKKRRVEESEETAQPPKNGDLPAKDESSSFDEQFILSNLKIEKILANNTSRKTICLQGSVKSREGIAVVLLQQLPFSAEDFTPGETSPYFEDLSKLETLLANNEYGDFRLSLPSNLNRIKITVTYPATQQHIRKYAEHKKYIVEETPKVYKEITLPYVLEEHFDLKWIYDILEGKAETDRILYEDKDENIGFTLVPDLKWDGTTVDTLYYLALIRKRDIKSLRDLTTEHLPLLKNIYKAGSKAIEDKFGISADQIRIYLHYRPSFYHLHVHFAYLQHEAPGITSDRAHLLTQVISSIELWPDYYQKVTLPFVVKNTEKLFDKFKEQGLLKDAQSLPKRKD